MGRMHRIVAGILLTLALPRTALADSRTDARRFFRLGMQRIASGDLEGGVDALQRAYDTLPHPNVLFNIARAYLDAGELEKAVPFLERYLASDPPDLGQVAQALEAVRQRVAVRSAPPPPPPVEAALRPGVPDEDQYVLTGDDVRIIGLAASQLELLAEVAESAALGEQASELARLADTLRDRRGVLLPVAPVPAADGTGGSDPQRPAAADSQPGGEIGTEPEPTAEPITLADRTETELYEERVVSASRFAQATLDAPNSTTVITAQDIRLSGLRSLPEIVRRAAGVDVMTLTPGGPELAVRGLNQRLSNKVQVLVDGRSVYLDFLGTTLWGTLPILPVQIERIELIRGPASALYGANAVGGVVNIITREPGAGALVVTAAAGSGRTASGELSVSGRAGSLGYRVGVGYDQEDHYSIEADTERADVAALVDDPNQGLQRLMLNADLRYRLGSGYELRGGTAVSRSDLSVIAIGRTRRLVLPGFQFAQTHASLRTPFGLTARAFWNAATSGVQQPYAAPGAIEVASDDVDVDVVDAELEFQRAVTLGFEHNLTLGIGYRHKQVEWDWLDGRHNENHFSAFVQDTMRVAAPVRVVVSARADRHPLLDAVQVSPRGSVVVRTTDSSAARATVGTAFRSPTFIESYLRFTNQTPLRGTTAYGVGNESLAPERIFSAEVGYAHQLADLVEVEANVYYNRVDDQILFSRIRTYSLADYPGYDAQSDAFPVGELQFGNEDATFQQLGGELEAHFFPLTGVDLLANYAYHETTPVGDRDLGGREKDQRTPAHKVNVGAQYSTPFGLDAAVDLHFVSSQLWVEQVTDATTGVRFEPFDLASYTILNARLGYRMLEDRLEIGIVGTHLLGGRHREHPFGQRLGRRIWATITARVP